MLVYGTIRYVPFAQVAKYESEHSDIKRFTRELEALLGWELKNVINQRVAECKVRCDKKDFVHRNWNKFTQKFSVNSKWEANFL